METVSRLPTKVVAKAIDALISWKALETENETRILVTASGMAIDIRISSRAAVMVIDTRISSTVLVKVIDYVMKALAKGNDFLPSDFSRAIDYLPKDSPLRCPLCLLYEAILWKKIDVPIPATLVFVMAMPDARMVVCDWGLGFACHALRGPRCALSRSTVQTPKLSRNMLLEAFVSARSGLLTVAEIETDSSQDLPTTDVELPMATHHSWEIWR